MNKPIFTINVEKAKRYELPVEPNNLPNFFLDVSEPMYVSRARILYGQSDKNKFNDILLSYLDRCLSFVGLKRTKKYNDEVQVLNERIEELENELMEEYPQ